MNLEIYYFSGTGNSLAAARKIAGQTGGTLLSIASTAKSDRIRTKADCIGIVFPCYLAQLNGIPIVVESFVKKLEGLDSKYIFAVCTCGGYECVDALPTLKRLSSLIRSVGGRLTGEFSVRLPMNNLKYFFFQTHNHDKMFRNSERKSVEICLRILGRRKNKYYLIQTLFNYFMNPLYFVLRNFYVMDLRQKAKESKDTDKKFRQLIPLTDRSIFVDKKCSGCGICAKVCPSGIL